ncbi:MAG: hypothetical protein IJU04_06190 [Ruminococcus sp.]|nr:hypothetical protein [Ruminococcus sp.]
MKRYFIWIIILLLGLVAFKNDSSIEISNRTLVHAVGIDEDDSGCTVTLQIFKTDGSGTDTVIDPSQTNTRVISNTAPTFNEAMSLCENQLGNYIFIGHNQVIVIGHDTDLSKPDELLSYFIRNKDNFLGVKVVLSETTAQDVLNVQIPTGTITMENFTEIIDMYSEKGSAAPSTMVEFINESRKPDKAVMLPVVTVKPEQDQSSQSQEDSSGSGKASLISIDKNAVIKNGKIVKEIDGDMTRCINLINNHTNYGMVNVDYNGTDFGVNLISQKYKSDIDIKDNRIFYNVDISLLANTVNSSFSQTDKDNISRLVEKKLERECTDTFNRVFFTLDCDVFDLSRRIRFYYPEIYLKYKDNYDALKAATVINVDVHCVTK